MKTSNKLIIIFLSILLVAVVMAPLWSEKVKESNTASWNLGSFSALKMKANCVVDVVVDNRGANYIEIKGQNVSPMPGLSQISGDTLVIEATQIALPETLFVHCRSLKVVKQTMGKLELHTLRSDTLLISSLGGDFKFNGKDSSRIGLLKIEATNTKLRFEKGLIDSVFFRAYKSVVKIYTKTQFVKGLASDSSEIRCSNTRDIQIKTMEPSKFIIDK